MPTLIQLEDLESLALNALRKVLTTTENPTLLTKAASIILRYCKSSPSQREGAGGRVMSSVVTKISNPSPSPNPLSALLTKQEIAQLRQLMPTLPMNQILDPAMVNRWRSELANIAPSSEKSLS